MSIYLDNAIDNHSLLAIQDTLRNENLYQDGKLTAGNAARGVKSNLQANPESSEVRGVVTLIQQSLLEHPTIKSAVYPDKFAKTMISRYQPGMNYGEHIDEAVINGVRTDIAFTLFLSEPSSYEGGELEIIKPDGRDLIKLSAGGVYLYPADSIHQVLTVTSGVRLAAVGWIQSKIRSAHHRQILFDLSEGINLMPVAGATKDARLKILNARNNLQRLWHNQ
jgi:PKHD-type hydroxylase